MVAQLPEFIAKMQRYKKRQIIITTHSYDILANKGIDEKKEVILLQNDKEGTKVTVVSDIEEAREILKAGLSMADVVIPMTSPEDIQHLSKVPID